MHQDLPKPKPGAVFYEDKKLFAALANNPITNGHVVVVWKKKVSDMHLLSKTDFLYLMKIVRRIRIALLKTLKLKKVYLIYMDEAKHVHWHLVPRYNQKGFNMLEEKPKVLKDVSLAKKLEVILKRK